MTVPAPRGPEAGIGEDSYVIRAVEALRVSVESGFREIREQLATFVTVREFDREHQEQIIRLGAEEADRKAGDDALGKRIDDMQKSSSGFRRWVVTAAIGAAGAAGALGSVIENAIHH